MIQRFPPEEIIENFNVIVKSGKVGMIGCSNWHIDRIARANQFAKKHGLSGFALSQIQWSLADTEEELFREYGAVVMSDNEYNWYYQNNIPIFAYSPQAQGFFTKAADGGIDSVSEKLRRYYDTRDNLIRLEKL